MKFRYWDNPLLGQSAIDALYIHTPVMSVHRKTNKPIETDIIILCNRDE